ncbi:MAG TPA: SMC-Scp complex subunit ScpB [Fimbriimonadaceae bacterium]|nr:SMC-Scp complex subunit ScpB [Fimbriimonadaceae bacterium]
MSLPDQLEALLFVADQPASIRTLATTLQITEGQVEQGLEVLEARLEDHGSLRLVQLAGGYQLATKPEYAGIIAQFLKPQRSRLSKSLLEVLAIVAYRQPLTLAEIEQVRGVQSDYSVRALVERRLLQDVGRKPVPGRPLLYGTTQEFLHQFKLNDLKDLPGLDLNRAETPDSLFSE